MATKGNTVERVVRTSVSIPAELDRQLRALAEKADRSLSREVRRAIERYVESEKGAAA